MAARARSRATGTASTPSSRRSRHLADDETLVIQSGKPVAVFRTSRASPRVLTANTNLVGKWATWDHYRELEAKGLMMYGQYTAGTWAYIGTQGILQGTYETFAAAENACPPAICRGSIVLTAGLGGMGGAQPLAVKMAGGVCVAVEVDPRRAERRKELGLLRRHHRRRRRRGPARARGGGRERRTLGIALIGNAAEMLPRLREIGLKPAAVTDQTSAHDPLNGYIPAGLSLAEASRLREHDPQGYMRRAASKAWPRMPPPCSPIRATARSCSNTATTCAATRRRRASPMPSRSAASCRCSSGRASAAGAVPCAGFACPAMPTTSRTIDQAVLAEFPDDELLRTWMDMAMTQVPIQGLPARTCWLGIGERDAAWAPVQRAGAQPAR